LQWGQEITGYSGFGFEGDIVGYALVISISRYFLYGAILPSGSYKYA
jgi:hypothetical protein